MYPEPQVLSGQDSPTENRNRMVMTLCLFPFRENLDKWGAVEVSNNNSVPKTMESFNITSGLYAVFDYKGLSTDNRIFEYIFGTWLPRSEYLVDDRPHFEILGENYKNGDPNSEEEIWIPVKRKQ